MDENNKRKWFLYGAGVGLVSVLLFLSIALPLAGFERLLEGGGPAILAIVFLIPVVMSVPAFFGFKRWSAVFYLVYLVGMIIFTSTMQAAANAKTLGGALIVPILGMLAAGYAIALGVVAGFAIEVTYQVYGKLKKWRPILKR